MMFTHDSIHTPNAVGLLLTELFEYCLVKRVTVPKYNFWAQCYFATANANGTLNPHILSTPSKEHYLEKNRIHHLLINRCTQVLFRDPYTSQLTLGLAVVSDHLGYCVVNCRRSILNFGFLNLRPLISSNLTKTVDSVIPIISAIAAKHGISVSEISNNPSVSKMAKQNENKESDFLKPIIHVIVSDGIRIPTTLSAAESLAKEQRFHGILLTRLEQLFQKPPTITSLEKTKQIIGFNASKRISSLDDILVVAQQMIEKFPVYRGKVPSNTKHSSLAMAGAWGAAITGLTENQITSLSQDECIKTHVQKLLTLNSKINNLKVISNVHLHSLSTDAKELQATLISTSQKLKYQMLNRFVSNVHNSCYQNGKQTKSNSI